MSTKTYHGSCHCGAVKFEADLDLETLIQCNCSICSKKGAMHQRITREHFRLLSGESDLQLYQFNKNIARHQFCRHCGIHAFANPRSFPDQVLVNVRCLDDFDIFSSDYLVKNIDGRNWEAHFTDSTQNAGDTNAS